MDIIIKEKLPLFDYEAYLAADEYDVYSHGELVYSTAEFSSEEVDYSDNDSAVSLMDGTTLIERCFDYSKQDLSGEEAFETKRGIRIGSTLEEVVLAYDGIECLIMKPDDSQAYLSVARLTKQKELAKLGDSFTLRITSCYIRGTYWDRKQEALSTHSWFLYDYDNYPWFRGDIVVYSITFDIADNIVEDIICWQWNIID